MAWVKSGIRITQALNGLGVIGNKKMTGDVPWSYSLPLQFAIYPKYNMRAYIVLLKRGNKTKWTTNAARS